MNVLSYRTNDGNGLSFELLVDGQPLGLLVGARDTAIPYWYIEDDLPYIPPNRHGELRIVTVCSCGDDGCGHTECRVIRDDGVVVFRDFDVDVSGEGSRQVFQFSNENYESVIGEIAALAREYVAK